MLHIALCDDEAVHREAAGTLLKEYLLTHGGKLTIFASAKELINSLMMDNHFDVFILDVIMPDMQGIELGGKIREMKIDEPIIYLTSSPDYAIDSYLTRAFYYLLKPVDKMQLFSVLDEAVTFLKKKRGDFFVLKTKNGLQQLELDLIVYGELVERCIRLQLSDGRVVDELTLRRSFKEEAELLLAHRRFALCATSFFVNLDYIEMVERDGLRLKGDFRLPLSRALRDDVTNRWMDCCLSREVLQCW